MNIRAILMSAAAMTNAAAPVAFMIPLVACNSTVTTSQVATDVNLLATGLAPVVAALSTAPNVSPALVAQAQAYLATIQADAASIAKSTATPAVGTVQQIAQVVQALASIAGTVPLLAPYAVVIQAAVALLPVILAQVGITATTGAAPVMTSDTARGVLEYSAQHGGK